MARILFHECIERLNAFAVLAKSDQGLSKNNLRRARHRVAICNRDFCLVARLAVVFLVKIRVCEQIVREPIIAVGQHSLLQC